MADYPFDIVDHQLPYESHNTYTVHFYGDTIHTTLTHDPAIVTRWITNVEEFHGRYRRRLIVGLDAEWRPSRSRYVQNPVATLQLCVGHRCLIFQLIYCPSIPDALLNFLSNPNYTFVGIGIENDLEKLEEDYELGLDVNTVDLRLLAARVYGMSELRNAGLKTLASTVLSMEVEKPRNVTMSRWDNEWLTPAQVQYACIDAYVCFEIGRTLNAA